MPGETNPDDLLKQLPDMIQAEVVKLLQYEPVVLEALQQAANHTLFLKNPAALLRQLNIPVSDALAEAWASTESQAALQKLEPFTLPDGQVVTPRLDIEFTKARE